MELFGKVISRLSETRDLLLPGRPNRLDLILNSFCQGHPFIANIQKIEELYHANQAKDNLGFDGA